MVDELNRHLTKRFEALRDGRSGPIFFLEHGLNSDEREELLVEVQRARRFHRIDAEWWRGRSLPLLVAATEVGYKYQGCGTDFWPLLAEELKCEIEDSERQSLKDLFREAALIFRGALPKVTPWSGAFHLIAWPIVHAIVPVEFQRRLAVLLADLRVSVSELDDDRLYRAIILVSGPRNARFAGFLEEREIVVAIARHLLTGANSNLAPEALSRIAADLAEDGSARRDLLAARGIQRTLGRKPAKKPAPDLQPIVGRLQLQVQGSDLVLQASFPAGNPALAERLRRSVRRLRYAPRLWGATSRVPAEQFLSPVPFVLRFPEDPSAEAALLPDLQDLDIETDLKEELGRYSLQLKAPMVFSASSGAEPQVGKQISDAEIPVTRNCWILLDSEEASRFSQLTRLGPLGPFQCVAVNPASPEGRRALESLGFRLIAEAAIGFAGPPSINGAAPIPEFFVGDTRVLFQRRPHATGLKVQLAGQEVALTTESLRIAVARGEQVLRVGTESQERKYRFRGVEASSPALADLVRLSLTSSEGTIQALQSGAVGLRIETLAPFDGLELFLELSVMGYRASACVALGPLPRVLLSDEPIWDELLDDRVRRLLSLSARCELRARVGTLASATWELEQRIRPSWWTVGTSGPTLLSEAGVVPHLAVSPADPTGPPQDVAQIGESVSLLVPASLATDGANEFVTFCVGSPTELAMTPITKPKFGRSRSSRVGRLGFEQLVCSHLRWSLAETSNLGAEVRRRQVARTLDGWTAEVCCGEEWATAERSLSGESLWQTLLRRCIDNGLGLDGYVDLLPGEATDICYEGIAEARRILPELLVRAESFGDDDRILLNAAFGRAYEVVAGRYERKGHIEKATRLREGDPSTPLESWRKALSQVRADARLDPIASLLLPTAQAARLVCLNASTMTLDELHAEFKSWAMRAKSAFCAPPPPDETLACILNLWVSPARAAEMDWRTALDTLLTERCVARAARYLSLSSRQGH